MGWRRALALPQLLEPRDRHHGFHLPDLLLHDVVQLQVSRTAHIWWRRTHRCVRCHCQAAPPRGANFNLRSELSRVDCQGHSLHPRPHLRCHLSPRPHGGVHAVCERRLLWLALPSLHPAEPRGAERRHERHHGLHYVLPSPPTAGDASGIVGDVQAGVRQERPLHARRAPCPPTDGLCPPHWGISRGWGRRRGLDRDRSCPAAATRVGPRGQGAKAGARDEGSAGAHGGDCPGHASSTGCAERVVERKGGRGGRGRGKQRGAEARGVKGEGG
mmetsp:Transcript_20591/g.49154  ORF Transcript_20591/g.49154 Transcript_20591/m.49154 type:complete len:273 (+) Transcript_20591:320-1138(+)